MRARRKSARTISPEDAITAIVSGNFFSQAYLAVYMSARSILQGKPLPQGWLKVPHVNHR